MNHYPTIIIKNSRINAIKRKHPWIFSGAVKNSNGCNDGDLVEVCSPSGQFLATGYFQNSSIMVRVLSFEKRAIDVSFWQERIDSAIQLRQDLGIPNMETNAFRLIHGEGDGVPGLIIDIYKNAAVIQCHAIGVHMMIDDIAEALLDSSLVGLDTIYIKSGATLPQDYAQDHSDYFFRGEQKDVEIKEHGCTFLIDIVSGQKTGFFLDQRENRALLQKYANNKNVLNLFCYTGGFSIYALLAGAHSVMSVDVSDKAIELCKKNVLLNGTFENHDTNIADVNSFLKELSKDEYDIIIVDPPAFAKSVRKKHNAVQAYKRVNATAITKIKSGGLIFTFSCSQVIDRALFYNTITAAAIEANRSCQVIHHLSQGPDHPVSLFHPEGHYLKGLVIKVT